MASRLCEEDQLRLMPSLMELCFTCVSTLVHWKVGNIMHLNIVTKVTRIILTMFIGNETGSSGIHIVLQTG